LLFWRKKPKPDTRIIIGLGNPGEEYARNRHNLGFMCIRDLAQRHGIRLDRKQGQARTGEGKIAGVSVVLARPQTFVNRSGQAVANLMRRYRATRERLIVIHDEMDLPLGKVRIRQGGSSAGHRGIISIVDATGGRDFVRIRVGVGRPEEETERKRDDVIDHVLGDLTPEEQATFDEVIPRVSDAVERILTEGVTAAMNEFN
jgi:PTH1 family peptidyl-tRNA hydrolase